MAAASDDSEDCVSAASEGKAARTLASDFHSAAPASRSWSLNASVDTKKLSRVLSTPSGGTHYRFQNADGWCISTDSLRNGDPVHTDECAVSGGTTVSNAEWNASSSIVSGQAIVVALQSRLGFVNRAECLDEPGALPGNSNMQMWVCNGTNAQRWLINSNN